MDRNKKFQIIDSKNIKSLVTIKRRILSDPEKFRSTFLRSKGWAVVPVESASHFDRQDVSRLSPALKSLGVVDCLGVIADEVTKGPMAYRVPATEEGLMSFSKECIGLNALLVSEDEDFSILCTVDDYYLVAGPRNFVATAVGGDILKAREDFLFFASNIAWPDDMRSFLMNIATAYSSFEG